jgi:hypothetical protein
LLYWYKSTNNDTAQVTSGRKTVASSSQFSSSGNNLVALDSDGLEEDDRFALYLLYSYKSTNTDALDSDGLE